MLSMVCCSRARPTGCAECTLSAAAEGKYGTMVALKTPDIELVPLSELAGKVRTVPETSQLIQCAESIGISMGR